MYAQLVVLIQYGIVTRHGDDLFLEGRLTYWENIGGFEYANRFIGSYLLKDRITDYN